MTEQDTPMHGAGADQPSVQNRKMNAALSPDRENVTEPQSPEPQPTELQGAAPPEIDRETVNTNPEWGRRAFLGGTLGAFALWLGAACNRIWPSPTPTPPHSPLPTPTGTSTATPVSILSPLEASTSTLDDIQESYLPFVRHDDADTVDVATLPTDTPLPPTETPTETPTPRPTDTPTPVATPFPPGAPSKLGIHVERNLPELFDLLETQAVRAVTTLELDANFAAQIKQTSPGTQLIGRIHLPDPDLQNMNPTAAAADFVNQILPYADDDRRRPHFDGWISYNEPVAGNHDEMKRLADFEAERTRLLGERGIRSVIGNFATGGPDLEFWEHFISALQAASQYNGWLGLHEYSAPTIYYLSTRDNQNRYPGIAPHDDGWLTLRYRKVYNQYLKPAGLAIPLVFTECGVDGLVRAGRGGPADARGWQDFQRYWAENGYGLWGPGAYIEQLVWYDEALRQDDYVIGACIYGMATSGQWLSYDINGPALGVLKQYLSVHAPQG
ncbi:MAG: hypothetical protein AAF702_20665 [Chloroflexota bacterium]